MLFRTSLLRKEWSYAYYETPNSLRALVALGAFQGMLAFALFFVMQTLKQSVLTDKAPYFMETSYFSTVFIYLCVSYASMTAYFLVKFQDLSFAEVYDNSWYAMVHLGYSVWAMVLAKLFAQLLYALFAFAIGFLATIGLTSFLKPPLVLSYLISQFVVGAVNLVVLLMIVMTTSLAVRDRSNARYMAGSLALAALLLQLPTGFFSLISDRAHMSDVGLLFHPSGGGAHMLALLTVCVTGLIYCAARAARVARLFNAPQLSDPPVLGDAWGTDARIAIHTDTKNPRVRKAAALLERAYAPRRRGNALSFIVTGLLTVLVMAMLLVDGMLLLFNYASPTKETAVMGFIPYIFQSSTMEPTIHFNDIAFFEKIDQYVKVSEGDVILFKDSVGEVQVRRANHMYEDEAAGGTMIDCDIDHYPEDAIPDVMKTKTLKNAVYGRLVGVNRYLGVVILFANTLLGRILFLIVPIVLIFYSGQIRKFAQKVNRSRRE